MVFCWWKQCRLMLAYLSLWRSDLNRKERSYITISSFPKATVQVRLFHYYCCFCWWWWWWWRYLLLLLLFTIFKLETEFGFSVYTGGISTDGIGHCTQAEFIGSIWFGQYSANSFCACYHIDCTVGSHTHGNWNLYILWVYFVRTSLYHGKSSSFIDK